jgi:uncharacterized protein (TIGR02145 family)
MILLDASAIRRKITLPKYGFLYNWWATQDQGGGVNIIPSAMATEGWAVPSDANFTTLATYLGGTSVAGGKLKETGTTYWFSPNTGATNEVGFNGRGSGRRLTPGGTFNYIGISGSIFTSSVDAFDNGKLLSINYNSEAVIIGNVNKATGVNLRPFRTATTAEQLLDDGAIAATYTGNDGKIYRCTKIGTQVWIADNLAETKWSDGTWIKGYDGGTYTAISNAAWAALTEAALCAYDNDLSNVLI